MAENEKLTLTNVGKIDYFDSLFHKLMCENVLNENEKEFLLEAAILFIKKYEIDNNKHSYFELAYYIILKYSLTFQDFEPLYNFSFNYGFYPIVDYIDSHFQIEENSIENVAKGTIINKFRAQDITYTYHQKSSRDEIQNSHEKELCFVAPTSFGKSSIIIDLIKLNTKAKHAIIVPTKSLLSQTYRTIKAQKLNIKLISHDEMYVGEDSFIAVFTQERAIRLLETVDWGYDYLFIDEAHNLFNRDNRNILLSRLIRLNKKRNTNCKIIYLSPLISDVENLELKGNANKIKPYKIDNNLKVAELYYYDDETNIASKYNKYFNKYYPINEYKEWYNYIFSVSTSKNLIYFNRPKIVEKFAVEFYKKLPKIELIKSIKSTIKILKKYVHKDFNIVECLTKGVIYLHGKLPEYIKDYLEYKFETIKEIAYLISNSVVLEGVNLPISSLFILDPYSLSYNKTINLVGRINRLSEIFGRNGNISKLLPQIHFVKSEYCKNINMKNYLEKLRDTTIVDEMENPLLENYSTPRIRDIEKYEKQMEKDNFIINLEEEYFKKPTNNKNKLRHSIIANGVHEYFQITDELLSFLLKKISYFKKHKSSNPIIRIYNTFFNKKNKWITDFELKRLQEDFARKYYKAFIEKSRYKSLKTNINSTVKNFNRLLDKNKGIVYIGSSYGEVNKYGKISTQYTENVYVNLEKMTQVERTNIAIVKLKLEEDFVSFKFNKFIDIAFEYEIINEDEYNELIYGISNDDQIKLLKQGFPLNILNKLFKDGQIANIGFNEYNMPIGNELFKKYYEKQDDFYKFQIAKFLAFN